MTDLTIPDEAVAKAHDALRPEPVSDPEVLRALEAAAPGIVAAELRQLASALDEARAEWDSRSLRYSALGHAIDELITRADELDPAGAK